MLDGSECVFEVIDGFVARCVSHLVVDDSQYALQSENMSDPVRPMVLNM